MYKVVPATGRRRLLALTDTVSLLLLLSVFVLRIRRIILDRGMRHDLDVLPYVEQRVVGFTEFGEGQGALKTYSSFFLERLVEHCHYQTILARTSVAGDGGMRIKRPLLQTKR